MWKHKNFINLQLYAGETWVLNETVSFDLSTVNVDFISNNENFKSIEASNSGKFEKYLTYTKVNGDGVVAFQETTETYWTNQAYRTITFATSPTGDLLTWLQANGTKQSTPKLPTPTNVSITGTTVQWDEVANATSYDVLVDGEVWDTVVVSSGNLITSGTYIFNEVLTTPQSNIESDFVAKGNSLTADNVYGSQIDIGGVTVLDNGYFVLYGTNDDTIEWDVHQWQYVHRISEDDTATYTATNNIKLRTVIITTNQTVTEDFYNWFNSNTTKQ